MSQLNDIINRINGLTGYNVPTSSNIIINEPANLIGSGSVNQIVDYVNSLTGYNIPYTDVQIVSGSNVAGPVIVYTPYAAGGTIPTTGIAPGQVIKAEHVLRVINALNGVNVDDIIISGSLSTSGSNTLNGTLSLPFIEDGKYLYTQDGKVVGVDPGIESASYAQRASYADAAENANYALNALSSSYSLTASYALNGGGGGSGVSYITTSGPFSLTGIEIADYSNDVAVTFIDNTLKFIFGKPLEPDAPTLTDNGTFIVDRFNRVTDTYDLSGSFTVNGYTLVSASLYTGSVKLAETATGTTLRTNATTYDTQVYRLEVTASSPLDQSINAQATVLTLTRQKTNPDVPTISGTPNVQLGATNNQIEQGATGSIAFISGSGANARDWVLNYVSSSYRTPLTIQGSLTGSASIIIYATASYSSSGVNGSDNNPALVLPRYSNITYTKIRSLRYGATLNNITDQAQLEDLGYWDTDLGGTVGNIDKGTTTVNGQSISITWTGDAYHYIAYDKAKGLLKSIKADGSYEVLYTTFGGQPHSTTTEYYIYKSTKQTWNGSAQKYTLST
jgi:hypothetical protein